ncbi:hypothetical protein [Spirosoma spitsbergense]|nr:hypothetical protein [Spirosoma spitsbergense]
MKRFFLMQTYDSKHRTDGPLTRNENSPSHQELNVNENTLAKQTGVG